MKPFVRTIVIPTLALTLAGLPVFAQDHHDDQHNNQHYVHHQEWHKGARISHDDWNRGETVDWHSHHLRQPPRGYEWRQVDGNYVLAAVATGVIASVIIASSQPH
ncbi:MAG: RcnB family protein [Acidobacteriaceae bacterium]